MQVSIQSFINERPKFQSEAPILGGSLINENRQITILKPSDQYQNRIIRAIQRIFNAILTWLYPFERTNYKGIVAALDRTPGKTQSHLGQLAGNSGQGGASLGQMVGQLGQVVGHLRQMAPALGQMGGNLGQMIGSVGQMFGNFGQMDSKETLAYFQRFLSHETASSPTLKSSLDQLSGQYQVVEKFRKHTAPAEHISTKKLKEPFKDWMESVKKLKNGEQSLVLVRETHGDELFYLFSKGAVGTTLKIIGRGQSMVQLSGVQEVAVKGKSKIPATLTYTNISTTTIEELMQCTPLGDKGNEEGALPEILQRLAPNRLQDTSAEHLASRTDNFAKLIWTTLKEANHNIGKSKGETDRLKLRYELFTLFSILKEYRDTLSTDPEQLQTAERMLRICAQDLVKANQKGIVSHTELQALAAELNVVRNAVDQANKGDKGAFSNLKMPDMSIYPCGTIAELTTPSSEVPPPEKSQAELRVPVGLPTSTGVQIARNPQQPLLALHELTYESAPHQIIETIYATSFSPFKSYLGNRILEPTDYWVTRTRPQAQEIIQKLNVLSKRLADDAEALGELPMDSYESLVKMTAIVAFLTHHVIYGGQMTPETYNHLRRAENYSLIFDPSNYNKERRFGYHIHPSNARTYAELYEYHYGIMGMCNDYNDPGKYNDEKPVTPGCAPLRTQFALFDKLMPVGDYQHFKSWGGLGNYDGSSIAGSLHGSIPPLAFSLLALYHNMRIAVGVNPTSTRYEERKDFENGYQITRGYRNETFEHRDTQEAAVDDPESTINRFLDYMKKNEITPWREWAQSEVKNTKDPVLKEKLQAHLDKQAEYLVTASQIESNFSKEEQTALLLLLRSKEPQTELFAFMETHPALLSNPSVRNFIHLLFFNPAILNVHHAIEERNRPLWASSLSKKIAEYTQKAANDVNQVPQLLFFIRISERLKGIYKAFGYDTSVFAETVDLGPYLAQIRQSGASLPILSETIALQLRFLLKKPNLTQEEVCQILVDRQFLKSRPQAVAAIDGRELAELEADYQKFIHELSTRAASGLSQDHLNYVFDTVCTQRKLPLDRSAWTGSGIRFENGQYGVDLVRGVVKEKASGAITLPIPGAIIADPVFRKTFPDMLDEEVMAVMEEGPDGTKAYCFLDSHRNPCRVEVKNGKRNCYKSFPKANHPKYLQAASFSILKDGASVDPLAALLQRPSEAEAPMSGVGGIFSMAKKLIGLQKTEPKLPALLKQTLFIDPKEPFKGFITSDEGEFQFEVELEDTRPGIRIRNIIDLRGGQRSEAQQLIHVGEIDHPLLTQLKQFEHPDHILLWGPTGNSFVRFFVNATVSKIELPRYGVSFALEGGEWVCQDPRYAGYRISHSATLSERRGFAFSLLLEHPDRTRPKKLLVSQASAIVSGGGIRPPKHEGLAYYIWILKSLFAFYWSRAFPALSWVANLEVEDKSKRLKTTAVDIHPLTGEIVYEKGKEIEQAQELVGQALVLADYELAAGLVRTIEMENDEKTVREWTHFIKNLKTQQGASSIAIQATDKLLELIRDDEGYKPLRKKLRDIQISLFKTYIHEMGKFPAALRVKRELFERLAKLMKKKDQSYYLKHVTPFLRAVGESSELYVQYTDGTETGVPQLEPIPPKGQRPPRETKIEKLEALIHPDQSVNLDELNRSFRVIKDGPSLVMDSEKMKTYFNPQKLLVNYESYLLKDVETKRAELDAAHIIAREEVRQMVSVSADPIEQISILAKEKDIASETDLMVALVQNDFGTLVTEGRLPKGIDLIKLKQAVIKYYDLEVKLHLMTRCSNELSAMIKAKSSMSSELWALKSSALYDLLTYHRQYSAEENPELLIFEAFHFMTYRDTTEPSQVEHLNSIVGSPASITQAGTGSGKSSFLTIMRALQRARGSTVVTQKVLPHLYSEMLALMETRFGQTFKRKVYPLRFDLTQPLQDRGGSIFKSMYQKMLETVKNKGCILTDYKSIPVLEEKLWSLSLELLTRRNAAIQSDPLLVSHWTYLTKILTLLQNRDDQLMDEFDEPNRPVHRIQTQITAGTKPADFMINESLKLYDRLMLIPELLLEKNLQGDIPAEKRLECIKKVAEEISKEKARANVTWQEIYQYLMGQNEDVLAKIGGWTPEEKDALALQMNQFSTYLSLTLSNSGITKYKRSKDGKRIQTCLNGDPREAKFGNILEEINYSIQDYFQHKVVLPTFLAWLTDQIKDFRTAVAGTEQRFRELISEISLMNLEQKSPAEIQQWAEQQLPQLNQNAKFVRFFLERHLHSLKTGGSVASMNPQNIIDMSRAVSGISATVGSLDALHSQFQTHENVAKKIKEEMTARLKRRTLGEPFRYDPANPLAAFDQLTQKKIAIHVLIDGAGAYRESDAKTVAEAMLKANSHLKKVEYYIEGGTVEFVGEKNASPETTGFYFPQAFTTGSDRQFKPDAIALLTVSEPGTMEDLNQQEGRMRLPGQKVVIGCSQFAPPSMNTLEGIIDRKEENEKNQNAQDLFRAEPQRLRNLVRQAAKRELLKKTNYDEFLDAFAAMQGLFIQPPAPTYDTPGDYFNRNKHIAPSNCDPLDQLRLLKADLIQQCRDLGLQAASLEAITYSDDLRAQMPTGVSPIKSTETQLEVEEELEEENEFEMEEEEEMEEETETRRNTTKVGAYLPRLDLSSTHSAKAKLHPAFSDKIEFTESFLPLNRTDPIHRRKPFDDKMFRVGVLNINYRHTSEYSWDHNHQFIIYDKITLDNIFIGDILDNYLSISRANVIPLLGCYDFQYDIRTGQVLDGLFPQYHNKLIASAEFKGVIAQIKFMDGQIEKYTPDELAALTAWFRENGNNAVQMRQFFEQKILRNRPETLARYRYSQLWNHFQQVAV